MGMKCGVVTSSGSIHVALGSKLQNFFGRDRMLLVCCPYTACFEHELLYVDRVLSVLVV